MFGLSKTANRFLIGSFVVVVLGIVLVLVIAIRFFSISTSNQTAGYEFGRGRDAQACVDEGLRRHTVTIDPLRQVGEAAFVQSCLMAAKTNAEFCRVVPEFSILNQVPINAWADSKCKEKEFTDGGCRYIFATVVTHCEMRKHGEARTNSSH